MRVDAMAESLIEELTVRESLRVHNDNMAKGNHPERRLLAAYVCGVTSLEACRLLQMSHNCSLASQKQLRSRMQPAQLSFMPNTRVTT